MTQDQIKLFRMRAIQAGYNEEQISSYLSSGDSLEDRKQSSGTSTGASTGSSVTKPFDSQTPQPKRGILSNVTDVAKGVVKGVGSTLANASSLGQRALDQIDKPVQSVVSKVTGKSVPKPAPTASQLIGDRLKPTNNAQKVGFAAEQIGEFFVPGVIGSKIAKGVSMAGKAGLGTRVAGEALTTAGVTAGQGGSVKDVSLNAGLAAAFPLVGRAVDIAAKPARKFLSERIAPAMLDKYVIKPAARDFHFGKDPSLGVAREGLVANTREGLLTQITGKKKVIGQEIDNLLKSPGVASKRIDVSPALKQIDDDIAKAAESGEELLYSRLVKIREGITGKFNMVEGKAVKIADRNLTMSPLEAASLKRTIGSQSKWTGQAFDAEANQARVKVYRTINTLIDNVAPGSKSLNARYANMLTAEKALDHTINVVKRQHPFGLINTGIGATAAGASFLGGDSTPEALAKGFAFATGAKALQSTAVQSRLAKQLAKFTPKERSVIAKAIPYFKNTILSLTPRSREQQEK